MALALDPATPAAGQQGTNFFATSQTATLTTAGGSGVIIVIVYTGNSLGTDAPNTPTATGLTFTQRAQVAVSGGGGLTEYQAPYTTNFSGTVTQTTAGGGQFLNVVVFGISGAATSSSFDSGGPQTASGTVSEITANANDFVFCGYAATGTDPTVVNPWNSLFTSSQNFLNVQYQIVSATATFSPTLGTGGPALGGIIDAVKQASGGGSFVPYNPWPQMGPILAHKRKSVGWGLLMDNRRRPWRRERGLFVPSRTIIRPDGLKKAA